MSRCLIDRLRDGPYVQDGAATLATMREAAAEVERLRAMSERLVEALKRLVEDQSGLSNDGCNKARAVVALVLPNDGANRAAASGPVQRPVVPL